MKFKEHVKGNFFKIIVVVLLTGILFAQLQNIAIQNQIHEELQEISDGIEVEIVDSVYNLKLPGLPKLPAILP